MQLNSLYLSHRRTVTHSQLDIFGFWTVGQTKQDIVKVRVKIRPGIFTLLIRFVLFPLHLGTIVISKMSGLTGYIYVDVFS